MKLFNTQYAQHIGWPIELVSNNPVYAPMFFSNEEIASKPVKIIGRVMEIRAKF